MIDTTLTTKHFYQHTGIGHIFVVEVTWNRIVVGSYGPVSVDDLKPPDNYDCTTKINAWLEIQKDMLVMIGNFPRCLPKPQRLLRNSATPKPNKYVVNHSFTSAYVVKGITQFVSYLSATVGGAA
jgi:hypothetical protein